MQAHIEALSSEVLASARRLRAAQYRRSRSTTRCSAICRRAQTPEPGPVSDGFPRAALLRRRSPRSPCRCCIHLTQREKKQVVEFPSLMFLRRIPYQSVRRRRIRDWLLLAMRLAALALIVLAFARPFLQRPDAGARRRERRARSGRAARPARYSMGYGDRWERARAAARARDRRAGRRPIARRWCCSRRARRSRCARRPSASGCMRRVATREAGRRRDALRARR